MNSTLAHTPHNLKPQRGDVVLSYVSLHIPSGKRVINTCGFLSRRHLLELLGRWNAQQPSVWQYWEASQP